MKSTRGPSKIPTATGLEISRRNPSTIKIFRMNLASMQFEIAPIFSSPNDQPTLATTLVTIAVWILSSAVLMSLM